ncbi:MAG: SMP-30/gluconolactonase/LRE family protein [Pseudomonadota bacterium]
MQTPPHHRLPMISSIRVNELSWLGEDLRRPECVLCTARGDFFASDANGGIVHIAPNGTQRFIAARNAPDDFLPNGFALLEDRSFLIANLGPSGGVWRMAPDGESSPFLTEIDGRPIPGTNFVNVDDRGRIWISVSTWRVPREQSFRRRTEDGFIILVENGDARIVRDDIGFTNENKVDPSGEWLYVNETITRRLSRFRIKPNNDLGPREVIAEFADRNDSGIFPDGFDFDENGGIWIASVVSNRLARIDPDGQVTTIIDNADQATTDAAIEAWRADEFSRNEIDAGRHGELGNLASVTFAGADRRIGVLGSLFADRIATFRSPVSGVAPAHWHF